MNRTLKIGLIGFSATIGIAILLKLVFGISTIYLAPLALPWGVVVIFGATYPSSVSPKGRDSASRGGDADETPQDKKND
jgi:hypothetical protein